MSDSSRQKVKVKVTGDWFPYFGSNWKRIICIFLGHKPKLKDAGFGSVNGRLFECKRCGMIGYGELTED